MASKENEPNKMPDQVMSDEERERKGREGREGLPHEHTEADDAAREAEKANEEAGATPFTSTIPVPSPTPQS